MSTKRNFLAIKEKMEIINYVEKNSISTRAAALKFNISKSQSAAILKNKESLKLMWCSNKNMNVKKRVIATQTASMNKLCCDWFSQARNKNIPLSGSIIKEKAKEIAQQLGMENFKASNGWLDKWKVRNNITYKSLSGEAADVNTNDVQAFKEKLPSLLLGYKPENIYNADETGLFYRALPQKTFAFKTDKCIGGKLAKDRITILFCANMAGTIEKPLIIGKAAKPRAFKNVNVKDLPVVWKFNKKAWMTTDIMTEWLQQFDRKMKRERRMILLFLDNATSHPKNLRLENIKIIYLPPNCTSICQPLDQGIIKNFKFYYRSLMLKNILSKLDGTENPPNASQLSKSINILEAIYFVQTAWKNITKETVSNCFRHAGFVKHQQNEDESEDDLPLSTLVSNINRQFDFDIGPNAENIFQIDLSDLSAFVDFDDDIYTESNELSSTLIETINIESGSEEEEEVVVDDNESTIHSISEALKVLQPLKEFAKEDYYVFEHIKNIESYYCNKIIIQKNQNLRQTTMNTYFKNV